MEKDATYSVRVQKDGRYVVIMSRPNWAARHIPDFRSEADANEWIVSRQQSVRP